MPTARRHACPCVFLTVLMFALLGGLSAGSPGAHAADAGGEKVVRIVVEGNQRISDEAVLHLMTVKAGDPYDESALKAEFKRLWQRGLFEDLSIESRDAEGGKAIIVRVTEKPVVNSLKYDESKVITESQIEDALKTRNAQVAVGEPVDYNVLKKAEEGIRSLLNQKGYLDAEVHSETRDTGNGNVEVSFKIEEGAKTRIKSIKFNGNTVFSSRRLKRVLKNTKEHGWFTRFKQKDIYHPLKYDTDLREVANLYGDNGYIDLDLPPATVTVVEEKKSAKAGKSRKWVAIEQRVVEGRQYRVGEVKVSGNTVFTTEELVRLLPLRKGEILSESFVKAALALVDAQYGEKGYFYVSTNRIIDRHPDGTADITVKINEDRQYYLDRIEFAGNNTTRDFVLRREMPLAEGDLFDLRKFRLGLRRISQLGYFQLSGEPAITPVPGENKLKVEVAGTEPRRSELQVGGGYSGLDGGFFAANYSTRNFLGRGNLVTVNAQIGSISTRYQLNFTEPYLFDRPITAGFSIYRRDTDYVGFSTSGSGASVTLGRRFLNFHNASVSMLHERTDFDPVTGASTSATTTSLRPFYSYDTRNNFFRPSRGLQFFFSGEYAGGVLGGENSFVKPQLELSYYKGVYKNTFLALHAELGYVAPFGGDLVPTYERYFLGGERSLRNYGTRSVGPPGWICRFGGNRGAVSDPDECPGPSRGDASAHLKDNGHPLAFPSGLIGGNKKFLFNLEYVVPLTEPVDFVAYLDVGNSFGEWERVRLNRIISNAGIELRFFLPVFGAPLRLIYGQVLGATSEENCESDLFGAVSRRARMAYPDLPGQIRNACRDPETKSFLFSIGTTF